MSVCAQFILAIHIIVCAAQHKGTVADTIEGLLMSSLQTGSEIEGTRDIERFPREPWDRVDEQNHRNDEHVSSDEISDLLTNAALTLDLASSPGTYDTSPNVGHGKNGEGKALHATHTLRPLHGEKGHVDLGNAHSTVDTAGANIHTRIAHVCRGRRARARVCSGIRTGRVEADA